MMQSNEVLTRTTWGCEWPPCDQPDLPSGEKILKTELLGILEGDPQAVMLCVLGPTRGLRKIPNGTLMFCVNLISKHSVFKIFGEVPNSLIMVIMGPLPFNT